MTEPGAASKWRISWRSNLTGAKSHGKFYMDFAAAASLCSELNAKWPDFSHWPERELGIHEDLALADAALSRLDQRQNEDIDVWAAGLAEDLGQFKD